MESGVGREEEEERGEGRSGGREGNRGGGKGEPRRRDGDADRGPAGGGDRFVYGQWGEGRGRREEPAKGGASLPSFPRGTLVGLLSRRSNPLFLGCLSPETFTRFLPCSPREAGCPDPSAPIGRPGAAARDSGPLRDMERKRQLLGVGPALPISSCSSPRLFFPWLVFVTVAEKAAARPWGLRRIALGVRSPPRELFCLPRVP